MEELIGELLYAILEIFAEVFIELAGEAILGAIVRFIRNSVTELRSISPVLTGAGYLLLGAGFGMLTTYFFPHPFIHRSRFHGVNLLISPILTGFVMSVLGQVIRRKGKIPIQIESFGYGFTFALGMALIRFLFAR